MIPQPTGENILIKPHKSGFTSMVQVDENNSLIEKATIIAIGEDVTKRKVGEVISFKDYETDKITEDGIVYIIIQESAIKLTWNTNTPSEQ